MNLHQPVCTKGRFHGGSQCTCEVAALLDRIKGWAELNATASRDFGRGYAHAIQDVIELLQ